MSTPNNIPRQYISLNKQASSRKGGIESAKARLNTRVKRFQAGRRLSEAYWQQYYRTHGVKKVLDNGTKRGDCYVCGKDRRLVAKGKCRTCYNAGNLQDRYLASMARDQQ